MEYITFDIVRFLKDARKWAGEIDQLETKRKILSDYNPMCILDGETVFVVKERVELKIAEIKAYQDVLDKAVFILNNDERELLMGFFFSETPKAEFVDKWIKKHHSNQRYCYEAKDRVLDKMSKFLLEYYQEGMSEEGE